MASSCRSEALAASASTPGPRSEQLTFIQGSMQTGASAADAHRILAERILNGQEYVAPEQGAGVLVLLAERDPYAADLAEYFLRTEGYEVILALGRRRVGAALRGTPAGGRRVGPDDLRWPRRGALCSAGRRKGRVSSRCRRFRNANEPSRPGPTPSSPSRSIRSSSYRQSAICWAPAPCGPPRWTDRLDDRTTLEWKHAVRRRARRRTPDERHQPDHRTAGQWQDDPRRAVSRSTTRPTNGPVSSCRPSPSPSTRCCDTESHSTFFDADAIGTACLLRRSRRGTDGSRHRGPGRPDRRPV